MVSHCYFNLHLLDEYDMNQLFTYLLAICMSSLTRKSDESELLRDEETQVRKWGVGVSVYQPPSHQLRTKTSLRQASLTLLFARGG